ncbi:MAG: hypothetical protein ABSG78_15965 [Verrucomicrobiota bacterium]
MSCGILDLGEDQAVGGRLTNRRFAGHYCSLQTKCRRPSKRKNWIIPTKPKAAVSRLEFGNAPTRCPPRNGRSPLKRRSPLFMVASRPRKPLALDTNLLLDLADAADFAHDFKDVFQGRGCASLAPPTVLAELHEQSANSLTTRKRELALLALGRMLVWGNAPVTAGRDSVEP